jgi:RNA polymerase primary sigma factor
MNNGKKNLSGEREALGAYLAASRALPPLSRGQERELATRARDGEAAARDEMVRRHLPLVVVFARKQARGGVSLEELVQEGNLGVLRAIEKYDPAMGTRFSTYALWWIRAFVWRYLKQVRSSVRPRSGTAALADLSLDSPVRDQADATYLERIEDDSPSAEERYDEAEDDARLRGALEKVRGRVGELGWDIIHSRLKQDPPDTLEQIGRRWNLSRERVRQVEVATKRFLRDYLQPVEDARHAA